MIDPIVFIFGACIGSFLNVCIYRIPQSQSIVRPGSVCPRCGKSIPWYENIPLLSYFFLRGKCSNCKATISIRYPLVELITGLVGLLLYRKFGLSFQFFYYFVFLSALITVSFIDLRHRIIPDIISLPGMVLGVAGSFFIPSLGPGASFSGLLLGGGILFLVAWGYYLVTKREGMGGGDIKLLALIGAFLGWQAIPLVLFLSALGGAVVGGGFMLFRGADRYTQIPFGPFLSLGAALYLFCPWIQDLV